MIKGAERSLGTIARSNHDLLERHGSAVARSKHARHIGVTLGVHQDLAKLAQVDRAPQEFGVGH